MVAMVGSSAGAVRPIVMAAIELFHSHLISDIVARTCLARAADPQG
jgi:hypothetical protein